MSKDRFLLILAFFHLKDNRYYVPRGPFYERMLSRFRTVYKPHQALAIDESMARELFRVDSPDKPIKYGLKAYMLCDAENAFCLKFKLYTGRSIIQPSKNGATYDLERIFFETISKQDTYFSVIIIIVLHICSWTYGSEVQVPQVQCALTEKVFLRNLKRYL